MHILEHGQGQEKTLLFLPCTAEPVWAFEKTVALLAQSWHVFQVVYDGHEPSYPGDFTSVEQTVDEITGYDDLHPKLVWHRTKTLGRGNECCNFCLKLAGK